MGRVGCEIHAVNIVELFGFRFKDRFPSRLHRPFFGEIPFAW